MEELAFILVCKVSHMPTKFLGLLSGAKFKSTEIWNPILEKMDKRLAR